MEKKKKELLGVGGVKGGTNLPKEVCPKNFFY